MVRRVSFIVALIVLAMSAADVSAASGSGASLRLDVPAAADASTAVAVSFSLPVGTAAVDGRLLLDKSAAEVVGLAPIGSGVALAPQEISNGYAFGAYGLSSKNGATKMRIVLAPLMPGVIELTLVIDSAADGAGHRLNLVTNSASGALVVARGSKRYAAPPKSARPGPLHVAGAARELLPDGAMGKMDLDLVRAGWELARANGFACGTGDLSADANRDGCVDIVDVQAVYAARGQRFTTSKMYRTGDTIAADRSVNSASSTAGASTNANAVNSASLALNQTFTVTSAADTPDATPGDGLCADANGQCTLRAAVTESNWAYGPNTIQFNLTGPAPVTIQMGGTNMTLQDRTGGTTIDGYSQPGSQVNTSTIGSNAIPGVILVGTADSPRSNAFRVTSSFNVLRGLSMNLFYRAIFIDGADAHDNQIVGNILGFTAAGGLASYAGYDNIQLNTGANHNIIGTPALADRNVSGRAGKALYESGPGTDYNVIQNNVMCIAPNGFTAANCLIGVDNDFGPKHNLIGGLDPNNGNVVGPTSRQAIEFSHGWNPSNGDGSETWQINDNRVAGNWLGFRGDGSYDPLFRSGLDNPGSGDNGNGVNIHDGCNNNVIEGNWVASKYDGIQMMSLNSAGNIIRNNVVGQSPLGQAAPLTRDGIVARENLHSGVIEGNTVRNAGRYGIGITNWNVFFVRVSHNIVSDMSGPAIYFMPDPNNPATGADSLLAVPVVSAATTTAISGTGIAGATVEVYQADRGAGDSGLPILFVGSTTVANDGTWSVPSTLAVGDRIAALQILPNGNTSGLSLNVSTTIDQTPNPPVASFTFAQVPGTTEIDFSDTSTGSPASWNWNFGDGIASTLQNPSHTYSAGGDYTVILTASNAGGPNSIGQTITVSTPSSAATVANDAFSRTVNGGWGTADMGGAYTLSNPNSFNVTGTAGTINLPAGGASRSALLNTVSQRNQDITFRVAINNPAAGGRVFVYAASRIIGNNEYRPRLIFNTDGSVAVSASMVVNGAESALGSAVTVSGLTYTPGTFVWLRAQLSGANPTTVRVKAWADGQPEPNGWLSTTTSSQSVLQAAGAAGIRTYIDSKFSNVPLLVTIDDYAVTSADSSLTVATDAFSRVKSSTWGGADIGGLYTIVGNAASFNVNGAAGTIDLPAGGASRSVLLKDVSQMSVDIRFRVALDKLPVGGNVMIYGAARIKTNNEYRPRIAINPDGSVAVSVSVLNAGAESSLGSALVVPGLTASPGSFIWLHALVSGANPTTIRVRVWADGQAEPTSWQYTATDSLSALQGAGTIGLRAYANSKLSNGPIRLSFDDYSVTTSL